MCKFCDAGSCCSEFNLTDEIKDAISKAKADFKAKTDSLDLHLNKQERFGAKDLKQKNFGADAFMQLAIQVTQLLVSARLLALTVLRSYLFQRAYLR